MVNHPDDRCALGERLMVNLTYKFEENINVVKISHLSVLKVLVCINYFETV